MRYVTITVRRPAIRNLYLRAIIYKEPEESKCSRRGCSPIHPSLLLERTSERDFPRELADKSREQPGLIRAHIQSRVIPDPMRAPAPIPPLAEQDQKGLGKYTRESPPLAMAKGILGDHRATAQCF